MELIFAKLAQAEMAEARRYYERQQRGLGQEFLREASLCAKRISAQPLAWKIEIDALRSAMQRLQSRGRAVWPLAKLPIGGVIRYSPAHWKQEIVAFAGLCQQ